MNTPSELNERFLQQLQRLNPEQLLAVQQVEGPVLVLAGPGTGKTQVLATRIGSILLHTDARPQNILCLTFTDAGVIAMRERLLGLIGPDAHRVPVMTYHYKPSLNWNGLALSGTCWMNCRQLTHSGSVTKTNTSWKGHSAACSPK